MSDIYIFIPHYKIVAGYYGFTLAICVSVYLFPDNNFSEYQWIFTKPDMCIDIVEIWFGTANGQISSIFELSARHTTVPGYYCLTFYFFQTIGLHILCDGLPKLIWNVKPSFSKKKQNKTILSADMSSNG